MKYLATIKQGDKQPTLQFEDRELFQNYLKENIGKEIILDIKLNKARSPKQNSLYWSVIECFGSKLFHTDTLDKAKKQAHTFLGNTYAQFELNQEPTIKDVCVYKGVDVKVAIYDFSIAFDKLDNIEANKYYEWAFEFILEAVNKDRQRKFVEIMDYVEECKRGLE